METRVLTGRDDFGFVDRSDESVACGAGNSGYCQIIDDASVYFRVIPQGQQDNIYQQMSEDSVLFPGMPTGRIPAFYRALFVQRRFVNIAGKKPTVGQLVRILSVVDGATRGGARVDDAWTSNALVRGLIGLPLTPEEQSFVDAQAGGGSGAGSGKIITTGGGASGGGMGMLLGVAAVAAVVAMLMGRK